MAATITLTGTLSVTDTGVTFALSTTKSVTQTGTDKSAQTQQIGTSAEQLDIPADVGTLGYIMVWNQDATNFVELALDSGVSTQKFAKLRAGEFAIFPASTATMYAKADTGACQVAILAVEL